MLSACLLMTKDFRISALKHLGLSDGLNVNFTSTPTNMWLRSAKTPIYGEGLADKGFENCDRYFGHFNRVRCPRALRSRNIKQCDVVELITNGKYCNLRHTSEVAFSFFENVDALKDYITKENISIIPFALEWGCALINLQQPLRKPGKNSDIPSNYWD